MAIFSTHLLNSIDGTHASDVEIVIYKVNNNNKVVFLEDKTDSSGRMRKEFELTKEDCESDYEMIINSGKYFRNTSEIINSIIVKFKMKDPHKKYHIPLIVSPNGYSIWWSK
jgi:5-hydroxyisourate hydrolase